MILMELKVSFICLLCCACFLCQIQLHSDVTFTNCSLSNYLLKNCKFVIQKKRVNILLVIFLFD